MAKRKQKPLRIIVSYYPGFQERVLNGLQYGYQRYLENKREKLTGVSLPSASARQQEEVS